MNRFLREDEHRSEAFCDPWTLYQALDPAPPSVLLESARPGGVTGRYSILAADPFLVFRYADGQVRLSGPGIETRLFRTSDPFYTLRRLVRAYTTESRPEGSPFRSGAIGYLAYESKDLLQPRTASRLGASGFPSLYFLFFDRSVVWDHARGTIGFHQTEVPGVHKGRFQPGGEWAESLRKRVEDGPRRRFSAREAARRAVAAPREPASSMTQADYERAVRSVQREIRSGEIFQANLAHRLRFPLADTPRDVYGRLRRVNPSPFFGLLEAGDFEIVSGSPERLVRLERDLVETRPIAGTRRRGRDRRADEKAEMELLLSEKERAEHVMLVDLERNDMGRVCEYGSVRVDEFFSVEDYSHVKHIVSNVRGRLGAGRDAFDVLESFFPGGTITGAPKVRCMQIIDENETVPRGPYTGSLGYLSFSGDMDFNILIRSLAVKDGRADLHVGAGIVADSDPQREYHETLYKAEAVLEAVFGEKGGRVPRRPRELSARVS